MTTQIKLQKKQPKHSRENIQITFNMAWPSIIESFFSAFAGLVDSLMVSSLGAYAVAAVGLTTQPKFIGLSLFFALNVAISALIARRKGEKKPEEANQILSTAIVFILIAAVVISILCVALAGPVIELCGSTAETHDSAVIYFRIIMGGMIFNCIQMGINSAQRGAGNTKITMRTNVTSNTVNIIFNYLLINGHFGFPALGIHGAALATVLGTVVACIMSILSILNPEGFINMVHIGYSVFFEQILMRIGFMMTAVMAAKQGTAAMAAHQVGMNIMGLSFSFGDGLQAAAVALIGRSLGAGDEKMAKEFGGICRMFGGIMPCCRVFLWCTAAYGDVFCRRTYYRDWRRNYAGHYFRGGFPDQPGGVHGMPAWGGGYPLYGSCIDHQRDLYPYGRLLFGRLCVWAWYRGDLAWGFGRPDFKIPVCVRTV